MTEAQFLEGFIEDVFSYKTVLYIGASPARQILTKEFKDHGAVIDLVEVWSPNLDSLIKTHIGVFDNFILGDVRKLNEVINRTYDVVCWWHGPEHVTKDEFESTLQGLTKYTNHLVVVACPYGNYPQGALEGNQFEIHHQALTPEDFHRIGWYAISFGKKHNPWSWVMAWYRKS